MAQKSDYRAGERCREATFRRAHLFRPTSALNGHEKMSAPSLIAW
jgi:hypothetical protein